MKYTPSEKMEIIRMVEESSLSVQQTLRELDVPRSSFYEWYGRYQEAGYDGLTSKHKSVRQVWNKIPEWEKERVLEVAREHPERSCREIAWLMADQGESFISESSVYRILKAYDLITSPVFTVVSAQDKFEQSTTRPNELWQTDFTYLKVVHWGWYYLSTVMDDFSRYIIAWQLCQTMRAEDVKSTLDMAIAKTGVEHVRVVQRPRLLSDNGACFISHELKRYLESHEMRHIRTKTYHPMTQGKIERYHRSMKNLILLDHYYAPAELTERIREWVDYYNHQRYHEAIDNVTPADKFYGRDRMILERREKVRRETMETRRELNRMAMLEALPNGLS
jgi:transposase InsO family protein